MPVCMETASGDYFATASHTEKEDLEDTYSGLNSKLEHG